MVLHRRSLVLVLAPAIAALTAIAMRRESRPAPAHPRGSKRAQDSLPEIKEKSTSRQDLPTEPQMEAKPLSELEAFLGTDDSTAATILKLLDDRDAAAEEMIGLPSDSLTPTSILSLQPALLDLEERTDASVRAVLPSSRHELYQRLRAEGIIHGVSLDVPPEGRPEPDEGN